MRIADLTVDSYCSRIIVTRMMRSQVRVAALQLLTRPAQMLARTVQPSHILIYFLFIFFIPARKFRITFLLMIKEFQTPSYRASACKRFGIPLQKHVSALFSCWCPHYSSPSIQQMNAEQSELSQVMTDTI